MVLVQILRGPPDSLLVSVLRSSRVSLGTQLSRLPRLLHLVALHAKFPGCGDKHHTFHIEHVARRVLCVKRVA